MTSNTGALEDGLNILFVANAVGDSNPHGYCLRRGWGAVAAGDQIGDLHQATPLNTPRATGTGLWRLAHIAVLQRNAINGLSQSQAGLELRNVVKGFELHFYIATHFGFMKGQRRPWAT